MSSTDPRHHSAATPQSRRPVSGLRPARLLTLCVVSLVICIGGSPAGSQTLSERDRQLGLRYDSILAAEFSPDAPGCVVLASRHGQVIYEKAFGLADLELNVPLTPESVFEIASNTKQMTAIAILQLAERGALSLQDPIDRYLPDYPTDGQTVTIEHLLTHTSGIIDYLMLEEFGPSIWRVDHSPLEFIEFFKREHLEFAPGTAFNYSNSGYYLLGYIIECASGLPYGQYVAEHLFRPAGMTQSCSNDPGAIIPGRADGYARTEAGFVHAEFCSPTVFYAAGALMGTARDFFRYYQALNSGVLVGREWLEASRTSGRLLDGTETGYGYGVQVREMDGRRTIAHAGGGPGNWTMHWYFPDEDVHFILFTNCEAYSSKDGLAFELAVMAVEG